MGTVNNCTLERESTLGVINENLSWADQIDFVSKKVNQRLGVLRRIKHLRPNYARNVFVSVMVLPFSDYCDIILGDRNSKVLMVPSRYYTIRLFSIVLYTLHLLRRLLISVLGRSIFGFDGAFIGLSIFLNALKH